MKKTPIIRGDSLNLPHTVFMKQLFVTRPALRGRGQLGKSQSHSLASEREAVHCRSVPLCPDDPRGCGPNATTPRAHKMCFFKSLCEEETNNQYPEFANNRTAVANVLECLVQSDRSPCSPCDVFAIRADPAVGDYLYLAAHSPLSSMDGRADRTDQRQYSGK